MLFKILAAVRRTRSKLTVLDVRMMHPYKKEVWQKFQEGCVYEKEALGKSQRQKGNLQRIETRIDNSGKIWVRKSTAMIELNFDRDIQNNKKNSYRYAGGKRKSRENGGPINEGNWRPDYLGCEED